ncbi:MAG: hypothetical protein DRJ15_14610 [Bacteroidetes bacterium]|nr:MAG: hypothetical protein DRJ15_14610 [Bacteroidota bacterium]
MAIIQEIETAREKVTAYITRINHLESEFDKAKKDTAQAKKALTDAKKEIEELSSKIKELIQEKENYEEAIKHFKVLGEKDKKEMDKVGAKVERLEKEIESIKKSQAE